MNLSCLGRIVPWVEKSKIGLNKNAQEICEYDNSVCGWP